MNKRNKSNKKLLIGLTGGVGTGKTTISYLFECLGARVISCDEIAHDALKKNTPTYKKIKKIFGDRILGNRKNIDRAKLGAIIFKSSAKRKMLEGIIHPFVFLTLQKRISRSRGILVIEVPLLFETGYEEKVDKTIVVYCSKKEQIERLKQRDGLSSAEARKRIKAQMPLSQKKAKADWVIDNAVLKDAVKDSRKLWEIIKKQYKQNKRCM